MDELEALKILKGEKPTVTESAEQTKKKVLPSDIRIYIIAAICGLLLLLAMFYFVLHPIDRLKLYFALSDSYAISTTVKSGSQIVGLSEVLIDGDIMYSNGEYYEIGEDQSYVYRQNNGKWYRYPYYQYNDNIDVSWVGDILDKDNYKRAFFPWAPMKYTKHFMDDMENVRMQMLTGRFIISGEIVKFNGWYDQSFYTTIEIENFGFVDLELPEEYTVIN